MAADEKKLSVSLGALGGKLGEMKFEFILTSEGRAYVQVFAHDPSDRRRSGVLVNLGAQQLDQLREILSKADEHVDDVRERGLLRRIEPPW